MIATGNVSRFGRVDCRRDIGCLQAAQRPLREAAGEGPRVAEDSPVPALITAMRATLRPSVAANPVTSSPCSSPGGCSARLGAGSRKPPNSVTGLPLTGQSHDHPLVILPHVTRELGRRCAWCRRRVALTEAGQIPLLMSHA